jgi:SAM-dependent methyltransferase
MRREGRVRAMKPIWAKLTFWRNLPFYHGAIRGTALATAFRSGRIFNNHRSAVAPDGSYFHHNAETTAHPFWADAFDEVRGGVREMLEIGAFEGRTTAFAARLFENARVTAVDPWTDYAEMQDLSRAEGSFRQNVERFGSRVRAIKGYSHSVLPKLLDAGERFDVVFIDGSHAWADVVLDSAFAWRLLNPQGVLIWDDYLWRRAGYGRRVPKLAIDQFLTGYRGRYTPLWAFKQVAIRKNDAG